MGRSLPLPGRVPVPLSPGFPRFYEEEIRSGAVSA